MEEDTIIPSFQKRELTLEYLSETYEDETKKKFKMLWTTLDEFERKLTLNQILELNDYREKSKKYMNELVSILKEEEIEDNILGNVLKYCTYECKPSSLSEQMTLNILKIVCDEIYWIDDILDLLSDIE